MSAGSSLEFTGEKSSMNMWPTTACENRSLSPLSCPDDLKKCRITNHGPLLYVKTNLDAPQHKVITVDLSKEEFETRDFISEVKDAKLVQVNCVNKEYFVVIYKRDVNPKFVSDFLIVFLIHMTPTG